MNHQVYSMSFTTGALLHSESVRLATLFLDLQDWSAVRKKVLAENLLQARTRNTLVRVCQEILSRLKLLGNAELKLLATGTLQEQGYILWVAVCRRYRFIGDFAIEVLREQYLSLNLTLTYAEFDSFFNRKTEWHKEVERITPTTRKKLRQVLFKMLREADLLTREQRIKAALLSSQLITAVEQTNRQDLNFFPVLDSELMR